jgi:hypothetical protein
MELASIIRTNLEAAPYMSMVRADGDVGAMVRCCCRPPDGGRGGRRSPSLSVDAGFPPTALSSGRLWAADVAVTDHWGKLSLCRSRFAYALPMPAEGQPRISSTAAAHLTR